MQEIFIFYLFIFTPQIYSEGNSATNIFGLLHGRPAGVRLIRPTDDRRVVLKISGRGICGAGSLVFDPLLFIVRKADLLKFIKLSLFRLNNAYHISPCTFYCMLRIYQRP